MEKKLQKLNLNTDQPKTKTQTNTLRSHGPSLGKSLYQSSAVLYEKAKCRSLASLCLGVLGKHFEDIIEDLHEIAANFPSDTKMAMMAIARRRKLLNDDVLVSLADSAMNILDISGSDVSDFGIEKVAKICKSLRAVDISRCSRITAVGVSELVTHCRSLAILRCGGCPRSDATARRCLGLLKPKLNNVEGESWEELDCMEISQGAVSLRWLVWPKIDDDSRDTLSIECPRVVLNPKQSRFSIRGAEVPNEALSDITLDEFIVKDIDPKTWEICGVAPRAITPSISSPHAELPIAERFRLAFVERDMRLAPKRAKNMRQHRRRAEKEWVMTDADAKSVILAGKLSKSLQSRS